MAQPDRDMVLDSTAEFSRRRVLPQRARTRRPHPGLHQKLQRDSQTLRMDKKRGPPKTAQAMFRESVILGTSILRAPDKHVSVQLNCFDFQLFRRRRYDYLRDLRPSYKST